MYLYIGEEKTAGILKDDSDNVKPAAMTHVTEDTTPRKESTNKVSLWNRLCMCVIACFVICWASLYFSWCAAAHETARSD